MLIALVPLEFHWLKRVEMMLMKTSPLLAGGDGWRGTGPEPVVPAAAVLPQPKSVCTKER